MAKSKPNQPPKYLGMAEALRREIATGALSPGDRLPSFGEMRARFKATSNTVQRVYSILEQDKLIIRKERQGVFVASPFARESTHVIGLCGFSLAARLEFYWLHVVEGIRSAAESAGREILFHNDSSSIRWDRVDGVVLGSPLPSPLPALSLVPSVALTFRHPGIPSVVADDYQGMYSATRHLLELGHRRIACLFATDHDPHSLTRQAGYQAAMRETGIEPKAEWIRNMQGMAHVGQRVQQGEEQVRLWLQEDWRQLGCTALLAMNDEVALGGLQAFQAAGIAVPDDVSVVGYDGTEISRHATPHLTTVEVPLQEMGATAVELLLDQREGRKTKGETVVLPTRLQVRESTAAPASIR